MPTAIELLDSLLGSPDETGVSGNSRCAKAVAWARVSTNMKDGCRNCETQSVTARRATRETTVARLTERRSQHAIVLEILEKALAKVDVPKEAQR